MSLLFRSAPETLQSQANKYSSNAACALSPSRVWSPLVRTHSGLGQALVSLSVGGAGTQLVRVSALTVRAWPASASAPLLRWQSRGLCARARCLFCCLGLCLSQFHHLPKGGTVEPFNSVVLSHVLLRASVEKSWIPSPGKYT